MNAHSRCGCVAVMLIAATMVTANTGFKDDLPAICFLELSRSIPNVGQADVVFSVLLLMCNILLRVLKLHWTVAEGLTDKIRPGINVPARRVIGAILSRLGSLDHYPRARMAIYTLIIQPLVAILVLVKTYQLPNVHLNDRRGKEPSHALRSSTSYQHCY